MQPIYKFILVIFLFLGSFHIQAQNKEEHLFGNDSLISLFERGSYLIYNQQYDSALHYIKLAKQILPHHPIGYIMEATNIAWLDQPFRTSSKYWPQYAAAINKAIALANVMRQKNPNDMEGVFFEMSGHGLFAELYAHEGNYWKAMGEAKKTYALIHKSMEWTDDSPEFLFLVGLYNYFREMYPEKHPVYKPLLWLFHSGDKALGIQQLDKAVHDSRISQVEAHLYTSYIYLRYEQNPAKAKYYIQRLYVKYPNNVYFKTKYLECEYLLGRLSSSLTIIGQLEAYPNPYYQLAGNLFHGLYFEKNSKNITMARKHYKDAIIAAEKCIDKGGYYKSMAYLGLGRIAESEKNTDLAIEYYQSAASIDESDAVKEEAESALDRLD